MRMTKDAAADTGHMDVRYVARLARLALTQEEIALYQGQLDEILAYVRELETLDVSGAEPTAHAQPLVNVLRDDTPGPSLPSETVLRNAPQARDGLFVAPRIIE